MADPQRLPELAPMPDQRAGILGATAGPSTGRVRAILAIALTTGLVGIVAFLAIADYGFGISRADPLLVRGFDALLVAFGIVEGLYFGSRISDTRGGG